MVVLLAAGWGAVVLPKPITPTRDSDDTLLISIYFFRILDSSAHSAPSTLGICGPYARVCAATTVSKWLVIVPIPLRIKLASTDA